MVKAFFISQEEMFSLNFEVNYLRSFLIFDDYFIFLLY